MDLGEKDDMCDYEKIHRLIESTYKNILKNFNPGVKQLIVLGKALQKTTQNVGASFKAYNECLYELARGAESCKGSTKELGLGLVQLTDSQSEINQHLIDSVKVFHAELLIPLKAKQENEFKHTQVLFDKYLSGHKYHSNNLRKAQTILERYKKKHKSKPPSGQKEMEKTRQMKECKKKLEEYLRKNLRQALLEERKRYCYLFNRLLYVVEDKVKKYTRAIELLMEGLRNWPELCRSPHILPRSSEQVIQEFGLSDEAGDLDEDQSGDEYHSTISVGTTLSLNRRDMRLRGPQRYVGWSPGDQIKLETSSTGPGFVSDSTPEEIARKMSAPAGATVPLFDNTIKVTESPPEITHVAPTAPPGILCAIYPYVAATDIQLSLEASDMIRVFGEAHNGWVYGRNIRTNKDGWFPLSFTDFNEELSNWKSSLLSHHHLLSQTRNASLMNIRNTWHTEPGYDLAARRPSRCSEADAAEISIASAAVAAAAIASVASAPASVPVSVEEGASVMTSAVTSTVSSRAMTSSFGPPLGWAPTENVDQVTARTKFQNRRTTLDPISEQIPPPEEFRDRTDQATSEGSVSMADRDRDKTESEGGEISVGASADVGAMSPSGEKEVFTDEEKITPPDEEPSQADPVAGNQTTEVAAGTAGNHIKVEVDRSEAEGIGPSLPPAPALGLPSKPPSHRHSVPGSVGQLQGAELGAMPKQSSTEGGDGTTPTPVFPAPSQPPPPPPPPPPLPPDSYQPRSEHFVRSRLRKAGSTDSTKTDERLVN